LEKSFATVTASKKSRSSPGPDFISRATYLYRPVGKGNGLFPGVLNPHGHWPNGRMADNKDGSIAARCISFARQGMVTFSYDMVGYNDTHFADSPASHLPLNLRLKTPIPQNAVITTRAPVYSAWGAHAPSRAVFGDPA
jgi:hypothetical protein